MSRRAVRIARERAHPFLRHLRRQGPRDLFAHWRQRRATLCDGRFVGWDNAFALVQDLYLDFSKCRRAGSHGNDELSRQPFAEGLHIYEHRFRKAL